MNVRRLLTCLPLLGLAACAVQPILPQAHIGPITGTVQIGERLFSCSQAGVFEQREGQLQPLLQPTWRPFALAGRDAREDQLGTLLVGGGSPAQSGQVALLTTCGTVLTQAVVAADLIYAVALAPDAPRAVAGCADGRVLHLSLPDLKASPETWQHKGPVVAVAYSHDGALLATAGHDGKILLGNANAATPATALVDHTAPVTCLAWAENGWLASGAHDGKVRLHDASGRFLQVWSRLGGEIAWVGFAARQLHYRTVATPVTPSRAGSLDLP